MENSNLIFILRTFSATENRKFKKWLLSPVHNQREDVVQLYDYLMNGEHLQQDKYLSKERIFSKLFAGETFDDARIRQTTHFLLKCVEDFLTYEETQTDEVRRRLDLARVYRQRQLDKLYQKAARQAEELQQAADYRNAYFLRNEYLLQREHYAFLSEKQKQRAMPLNLTEMSEALDRSFVADKLRQACLMLAHQTVYKTEYDMRLLQEVLQYVEQKQWLDEPAIGIYYYGYKSTTEREEPAHFEQLKALIVRFGHQFPTSEARDIYLMAINYCIARMNAGAEVFIREAFESVQAGFRAAHSHRKRDHLPMDVPQRDNDCPHALRVRLGGIVHRTISELFGGNPQRQLRAFQQSAPFIRKTRLRPGHAPAKHRRLRRHAHQSAL